MTILVNSFDLKITAAQKGSIIRKTLLESKSVNAEETSKICYNSFVNDK